jgi:hypothetical protein
MVSKQFSLLLSISCLVLCSIGRADIISLFPPPPLTNSDSSQGKDIGDFGIGVLFTATSTFSISDAAIQFNPYAGLTPDIQSVIYTVTQNSDNNGDGDINFTPAGCNPNNPNVIPGNCTAYAGTNVPTGVATSGITPIVDNGQQFYDTNINYTFVAGNSYAIVFFANVDQSGTAAGWGTGANNTERNEMTFWEWDPAISGDVPFTVGPLSVVDGVYVGDGGARNENFPAVELSGVPEPRASAILVGVLLLSLAVRKRPVRPIA